MVRSVDGLWKTQGTLQRPLGIPSGSCSRVQAGLRPGASGGIFEEGQCAGLSHMALLAQKYLETHCQGHG